MVYLWTPRYGAALPVLAKMKKRCQQVSGQHHRLLEIENEPAELGMMNDASGRDASYLTHTVPSRLFCNVAVKENRSFWPRREMTPSPPTTTRSCSTSIACLNVNLYSMYHGGLVRGTVKPNCVF